MLFFAVRTLLIQPSRSVGTGDDSRQGAPTHRQTQGRQAKGADSHRPTGKRSRRRRQGSFLLNSYNCLLGCLFVVQNCRAFRPDVQTKKLEELLIRCKDNIRTNKEKMQQLTKENESLRADASSAVKSEEVRSVIRVNFSPVLRHLWDSCQRTTAWDLGRNSA